MALVFTPSRGEIRMSRCQWDKDNSNIKQIKGVPASTRDQVVTPSMTRDQVVTPSMTRDQVVTPSIYTQLNDLAAVHTFMEHQIVIAAFSARVKPRAGIQSALGGMS